MEVVQCFYTFGTYWYINRPMPQNFVSKFKYQPLPKSADKTEYNKFKLNVCVPNCE